MNKNFALKLPTEAEAEYMVAKAIKDEVIGGEIVTDLARTKYLQCKETEDVYRTNEPWVFQMKISYLLHNMDTTPTPSMSLKI